MRTFVYAALALVTAFTASAALAGAPWDVEDSETTEIGHYQLNLGYASLQLAGLESQQTPIFDLAYGLRDNLEVALTAAGASVREAGPRRRTGFGDTQVAAKWRFVEETRKRPQYALQYVMNVPTGSRRRGLGTGTVDHTLLLAAEKSFGPTTLVVNAAYNVLGGRDSRNNWSSGLLLTRQMTAHLTVGLQIYGGEAAEIGGPSDLSWGAGFIYAVAPDNAILFQAGKSTRGNSDLNVYVAYQLVFH